MEEDEKREKKDEKKSNPFKQILLKKLQENFMDK